MTTKKNGRNFPGNAPALPLHEVAQVIERVHLYRSDKQRYRDYAPKRVAEQYGVTMHTVHKWARGEVPKRYLGKLGFNGW